MRPKTEKRIAPGIYRTARGFRAFVRLRVSRGQYRLVSKRFPKSATVKAMTDWRHGQQIAARGATGPKAIAGTLAEDIDRYLLEVAAMPTVAWRKRDLDAWRTLFGDLDRALLTSSIIRATLHRWRTEGPVLRFDPRHKVYRALKQPLSASACNHRRTALLHLYTILDGKDAPNPVRAVKPFPEPPPQPRGRDIGFLHAALTRIRNPRQRARAQVLLWTGIRGNSELATMTAAHVDLEARVCHVPTGKGARTMRTVPLTDSGVAAWQAFIAARAWGTYDRNTLRKSIQAACRAEAKARGIPAPVGLRAYDLRHTVATSLLRAGADLADVQDMLGHTTTRMTRRYAPFQKQKLLDAGAVLERAIASKSA